MRVIAKIDIPGVAMARLAVGLGQGIALYLLYLAADLHEWPATQGLIFAPLVLVLWLVPVILLLGLGTMRGRTLMAWSALAAAVLAGLALHDVTRGGAASFWLQALDVDAPRLWPSDLLVLFSVIGLFIANSLVVAGDGERKLIGSYAGHFDAAWKSAIQLALAAVFVGVFWLLLWLGAGLFKLVDIDFFMRLLHHRWFAVPATTLALACAIHASDARAGMVRGLRTLVLALLSWLLPLMTVIAVGFLLALPFTGLAPLWRTRFAASLLLTTAAALIVLINAAYREGGSEHLPPRLMRYAGSAAAVALVPLVAIAAYAVGLRVAQHGWTSDRIIATACLVVAAGYALGYAAAAAWPGAWLKGIETCNIASGFLVLAVLLALFTPLADPARLSVADQLARLDSGKIAPDKFDFAYLRFHGARYGRAALETLKTTSEGADAELIRRGAEAALAMRYPGQVVAVAPTPAEIAGNIAVYPKGRTLPESFGQQNWAKQDGSTVIPRCLKDRTAACDAYLADLDGDGVDEVILVDPKETWTARAFRQGTDGTWRELYSLAGQLGCDKVRDALRAGEFKLVPSAWREIEVAGIRLRLNPAPTPMASRCP